MRSIIFENDSFDELFEWSEVNKKIYNKTCKLIKEICREPFDGIGKPEPLKSDLKGYWSRRIDDEHRIVYKVSDNSITIISCKYHYSK